MRKVPYLRVVGIDDGRGGEKVLMSGHDELLNFLGWRETRDLRGKGSTSSVLHLMVKHVFSDTRCRQEAGSGEIR